MLRPEVVINALREAEGFNIDRGPQKKTKKTTTLNAENPWFNVIITYFISSHDKLIFNNYPVNIFSIFLAPILRRHG